MKKFFGKYRGVVVDNQDPEMIGRVLAQVPDVLGEATSSWARQSGSNSSRAIPIIRSGRAASSGRAAEVPPLAITLAPGIQIIVLQSVGGNTLLIPQLA